MLNTKQLKLSKLIVPLSVITLSACGGSDDNPSSEIDESPAMYTITVTNLTNAQPLSPIVALLHSTGEIWQVGQPASALLENLAESSDNSGFLTADFVTVSASSDGILAPGMEAELMLSTSDENATQFSLATMLVNTNDAFSGLSKIDLTELSVDDSMDFTVSVYDAGTESNSEAAGTIPGPADGGEGFNEARDDTDFVSYHPGVVSMDDGLTTSVLNNQHKFDNPAMSVKIVRTQ